MTVKEAVDKIQWYFKQNNVELVVNGYNGCNSPNKEEEAEILTYALDMRKHLQVAPYIQEFQQ